MAGNNASTGEYGWCSVCGRYFLVRKNGTIRQHGDGKAFPPANCPGGGKPPKTEG